MTDKEIRELMEKAKKYEPEVIDSKKTYHVLKLMKKETRLYLEETGMMEKVKEAVNRKRES